MKKTVLILLLVSSVSHAETGTSTENVMQACLKQAVALTQQLKSELFTSMNRAEADRVIQISSQKCQQHFLTVSNIQSPSENTDEASESSSEDWFTDYILSGDSPDKKGNKRLDRMRHK